MNLQFQSRNYYINVTFQTKLSDGSTSSPLRTIPVRLVSPSVNFVEETSPSPLGVRGSSINDFSIKLERTIELWASEVLRITPAPAAALQQAVLTDLTDVGETAALFTNIRPMTVQSLLRHAMAKVISDGVINSLIVTNSAEANLEFTRIHECLFARDATAAAVWRRHTFSVAVEHLLPEVIQKIFEDVMPSLAALLPDSADDPLGTHRVLQDAFEFSCMLNGVLASEGPGMDGSYRLFVPEFTSILDPHQIKVVRRCCRYDHGEIERVGATLFPGLVKILPTPPGPGVVPGENTLTVVRRALVTCECTLLDDFP
ncbi:hypothetical protein BJY52DRAFT_1231706 [Lactarius psammicola]|nr:hypothetical protein BJY52DRAFT_1231706 [Lactarius psammicola]